MVRFLAWLISLLICTILWAALIYFFFVPVIEQFPRTRIGHTIEHQLEFVE